MRRRYVVGVLAIVAIAVVVWRWRSHVEPTVGGAPPIVAVKSTTRPDPPTLSSIAGTITSEANSPIAGARVCAKASSRDPPDETLAAPNCAASDAAGAYVIDGLVPAKYSISASAKTFRPALYKIALIVASGTHLTTIDVVLRGGGVEVTGSVVDVTGGPIATARVYSGEGKGEAMAVTETDASGRFSLWVAPGWISVGANAEGYAEGVDFGSAPGRFEIILTPESSLAGTVVDATTNQPVLGARVTIGTDWGGPTTLTDERGAFRIGALMPGRQVVVAHTPHGFGQAPGSILVGLAQHVDGVIVKLFPAYSIRAKVIATGAKTPCADAEATLYAKGTGVFIEMLADPDGTLVAEGLLSGTYIPDLHCPGFHQHGPYPPVVIADKDPGELVWEVATGATIRGKVTTRSGDAVEDADVYVLDRANGKSRSQTGRDGTYDITGLATGSYIMMVSSDHGVAPKDGFKVDVIEGSTTTKDLVLDDTGSVSGTVHDPQGKSVAGVAIAYQWLPDGHRRPFHKSDEAGNFTIDNLPAGDYRINAQRGWDETLKKPGTTDDDTQGEKVTVHAKQVATVHLVIESASGTIKGNVIDHDHKPVGDAYVNATRESDARGAAGSTASSTWRWDWDERPVVTAVDGTFEVTRLSPGRYTVHAYRKGGGEVVAEHVPIGGRVTLAIDPTASIEGVVKRASGPVDQFEVNLSVPVTDLHRSEKFYKTDGHFTIHDLPAGHFILHVGIRGGQQKQIELDLASGEAKTGITLEVEDLLTLVGRVVEQGTQKPVRGIMMQASLPGSANHSMVGDDDRGRRDISDTAGRFTIVNAPHGRLQLFGIPDEWESEYSFVVAVRDATGSGTIDVGDLPILKRRVKRGDPPGDLGVRFVKQPPETLPDDQKLVISYIDPKGPAAKADLKVGDQLVTIDGIDVTGANTAQGDTLMRAPPGTSLALGLKRGPIVTVVLGPPN